MPIILIYLALTSLSLSISLSKPSMAFDTPLIRALSSL